MLEVLMNERAELLVHGIKTVEDIAHLEVLDSAIAKERHNRLEYIFNKHYKEQDYTGGIK